MKLVRAIRLNGNTVESGHAKARLKEHGLTMVDVDNVLRCGRINREGECEEDAWRYRVETPLMAVVVAFRSDSELVIVTVWRKR